MSKWAIGIIIVTCAIFFAGCGSGNVQTVSLHKLDNNIVAKGNIADPKPLRVAVSSILSLKETLTVYQPLMNYLENKLNIPVVLLQRRTYKEVNDLIEHAQADIAFVCSGGYVAGNQSFGMELFVVPAVGSKITYCSYIIGDVKLDAKSIDDLKGHSFAFTDPMSFSGRIAPIYMLKEKGIDAAVFFGRNFFTYSHDNSIWSVNDGIVDAAAVDCLIFDQAAEKKPELLKRVKIIDKSLDVGNPPVVVNASLDKELKEKLRVLLLTMHEDEAGEKALSTLHYSRFISPDEKAYDKLKNIWLMTKENL